MNNGNYKSAKDVCNFKSSNNANSFRVDKSAKPGRCPVKNYFKNENYIFLSGTVRPPYEREFEMQGVT